MNWLHWSLLSSAFAGLTAILAKVGVKDVDSNWATAIRTTVVLLLSWSIAIMTGKQTVQAISSRTWVFLALSGLATGISWLCYFRALQVGDVSKVAPIDKLSVVVVMVLGAVVLGESTSWMHWAGGLLITVGAVVVALRGEFSSGDLGEFV